MKIGHWIKTFLAHPSMRHLDIDDPRTCAAVMRMIHCKPFLNKLYNEWYHAMSQWIDAEAGGRVLELGSGAGFLKAVMPDAITSEILDVSGVDIVMDGLAMPIRSTALKAIVMVDVLHHLPDAGRFFLEAARCVRASGRVIMIEPWVTPWSEIIYGHLHHEPFDKHVRDWKFPRGGPLSQANSALPWIVFSRDKDTFERQFPQWHLKSIALHTPFRYLISGGVSMRGMLPGNCFNAVAWMEKRLAPLMPCLGMFATIVLERTLVPEAGSE